MFLNEINGLIHIPELWLPTTVHTFDAIIMDAFRDVVSIEELEGQM